MADLGYYAAKIDECRRLIESSPDQLYRDVYQAMADEFAEKYAALRGRSADPVAAPPSPMLHQVPPPPAAPEPVPAAATRPSRGAGFVPQAGGRRRNRTAPSVLRPV